MADEVSARLARAEFQCGEQAWAPEIGGAEPAAAGMRFLVSAESVWRFSGLFGPYSP
nr:hypothetical protein [Chromobacterium sp. ASV5]